MNTRFPMLVLLVTLAAASDIRLVAQATPTDQRPKHEYLYCASIEGKTSVGVRYGDWKLIKYRPKQNKKRPEQNTPPDDWRLYNLANDIGEKTTLPNNTPTSSKKSSNS